jgi:hypothetical protein
MSFLTEQEIAELDSLLTATAPVNRIDYHVAQAQVIREARRFNVVCCGRRWGKTILGLDNLIEPMLNGHPTGWFAPNHKYLNEAWRDAKRLFKPITVHKSEVEKRIELNTGGVLEFWTLEDPDAGRSRKYKRIIIDEAAKVTKLQESWEEALRATLSDLVGDAWFLSTPKGRNYFYNLFMRSEYEDDWQSWQLPTASNPYIAPEEIEAARNELPELAFSQEFLAEFIDDAGLVFRNLAACTYGDEDDPPVEPYEGEFVMGIDWGLVNDFTVAVVIDKPLKKVVCIDRFNKLGLQAQIDRIEELIKKWNVGKIRAEDNGMGASYVEELANRDVPVTRFHTNSDSKDKIIVALQAHFEKGLISIPNNKILLNELRSFEAKRLASGRWRYEAPSGMHDDTVIALAIALEAANKPSLYFTPVI